MRTDRIECFLVVPHSTARIVSHIKWGTCSEGGQHEGRTVIATGDAADIALVFGGNDRRLWEPAKAMCLKCRAIGTELRPHTISTEQNWYCPVTNEIKRRKEDFGPGAMWFADWEHWSKPDGTLVWGFDWTNQEGPPLYVMTPGGPWCIDQRASNCTMPNDSEHRCWVRHGEAPMITVDKFGKTCSAGAGSIRCGAYHGFLRNGALVL